MVRTILIRKRSEPAGIKDWRGRNRAKHGGHRTRPCTTRRKKQGRKDANVAHVSLRDDGPKVNVPQKRSALYRYIYIDYFDRLGYLIIN